ncbi:hypothetical protein GGS21DRAFT_44836 [Xylaria nigripes]|nr:hypothetical protein GGS21DRAFT_44836 [Xylaria nigripes]
MPVAAPTPPLLLTKRLTAFLQANLSPEIHTTLLTTISGKLLAHASPNPVSALRTRATVAASLWALYAAPCTTATIEEALPPHSLPNKAGGSTPSAITVQLTDAIVVIRRLRCGLLFVCIGPIPETPDSASQRHPHQQSRPIQAPQANNEPQPSPLLGSPSEVDSIVSNGAATTTSATTTTSVGASAVVDMRRQAEELARCLNDKLGSLGIPSETAGPPESR